MVKKIVLTGGGTVGHVTLNLLLIPKLVADNWEVHYIGDKNGVEYQQIQQLNQPVTFHSIATGKLRRYFSWQNLMDVFKVTWGVLQSLAILAKLRPQALFSKGGFVSVPPVVASRLLGIQVFIHESDLSMGLANKIAFKFATKLYTTFAPEMTSTKVEQVGAVTKVNEIVLADSAPLADITEQFDKNLPTLLFVGGSAGAKIFNDFVTQTPELLTHYNVINITGNEQLNTLSKNLYRVAYVTDRYQALMDLADLVITRGGSNTLFELLALRKPHLIVPLGQEASRGDQLENAAYFVSKGYAEQLPESELTMDQLMPKLHKLLTESDRYRSAMSQSTDITSLDNFYERLMADLGGTHG